MIDEITYHDIPHVERHTSRFSLGEFQERFNQLDEPQGFLVQHLERLSRRLHHLIAQRLQITAHVRQRGSQLMCHIAHQTAAELLDAFEAIGHPIKGFTQLPNLVLSDNVYPLRVLSGSELRRDGRHLRQGAQHLAGEEKAKQHGTRQRQQTGPEQIPVHRFKKHLMGHISRYMILLHQYR